MRRWIPAVLILLLSACASPPKPVSPPAEQTAEQPVNTPAPARPSVTAPPTIAQPVPESLKPPQPKKLSVIAVGDMMLDGSAREFMRRHGYDYAFAGVRALLEGDLLIGNLEGPLTTRGTPLTEKKYSFRSPPRPVAQALADAGFDAVTLANNHTLDFGYEGLFDTIDALNAVGIPYIGAGKNLAAARRGAMLDINGQKVGLLGYSNTFPQEFWAEKDRPGTAFGHALHVREDVQRLLAEGADIVIASFHWGRERHTELRDYQPLLAHAAIDAGAALVIGHHPHILQAVERYKDGLILYSMGNFTFGSYSNAARDSAVARVDFVDGKPAKLSMTPINVLNQRVLFQPKPLAGAAADRVVSELQQLSAARGTALDARDGRAVLEW
jgi:poly-gamma-glutamate synthesis protein (capsule biosynthesis protein)